MQISWLLPNVADILEQPDSDFPSEIEDGEKAALLQSTLAAFNVPGNVVEVLHGPVLTWFGFEPELTQGRNPGRPAVRVDEIRSLAVDLSVALGCPYVEVEAPVPGKRYVAIGVPKGDVKPIVLRQVMESGALFDTSGALRVPLGLDRFGKPVVRDLAELSNILVSGMPGSGKSMSINGIIAALLMQYTPDELKLALVDSTALQLPPYNGIPHLLARVITDVSPILAAVQWLNREIDKRLKQFAIWHLRDIGQYNAFRLRDGGKVLPHVMLVIDEVTELMRAARDEAESSLRSLAERGQSAGVHIVLSTQRPSADVLSGQLKACFPTRIVFAVASSIDSQISLGQPGAERLRRHGEMLLLDRQSPTPLRVQGISVRDEELNRLIGYWKGVADHMVSH